MDETPHTILTTRPAPARVDPSTVAQHIGHLFARSLLSAVVLTAVEGTLDSIPAPRRKAPELVSDAIQRAVRAAVNEAWGKKPICKVMVNVVDTKR